MSLFFCYHDPAMAVVASDDRSCFEQNGKAIVMPERVPKFRVLTGGDGCPTILSGLGRGDLVNHVQTAVAEIVREQKLSFTNIGATMPAFLQKVFAGRRPAPGLANDNLLFTLIGFNSTENCIWVTAWWSGYNFAPMPLPPFFAFGAIDSGDNESLQELQDSIIEKRPNHDAPWIASEFQKKMLICSQKHRERIGAPSYFAAIDLQGIVDLPKEFPLPGRTEIGHYAEENDFAPGRSSTVTIRLNKYEPPQEDGPITSHMLAAAYPTGIGIGAAPSGSDGLAIGGKHIFNTSGSMDKSTPLVAQASLTGFPQDTTSYTSTTSGITWSWTSFTAYFPDGSSITVSSGSQSFTGLTASTTYYFGFYITKSTGVMSVVLSDVNSGKSPESIQQQATVLNADGNIPLWVSRTAATTASGSGGGSGGGGFCFSGDVCVKTPQGFRRFDELPERFEIVNLTGKHWAKRVIHEESEESMRVMPDGGLVTEKHLFLHPVGGWVAASKIFKEQAPASRRTVYNMHVETASPDDMHYVLESGWIAHNMKKNCFSGDAVVRVPGGWARIDSLADECEIENEKGVFKAKLVRSPGASEAMCEMPDGSLISGAHLIRSPGQEAWVTARSVFPESSERPEMIYNLHVDADGDDARFILRNGFVALDMKDMKR